MSRQVVEHSSQLGLDVRGGLVAQVAKTLVFGVVVVVFPLDARVLERLDGDIESFAVPHRAHLLGQLGDGGHLLELIQHPILAFPRRVVERQCQAGHRGG